ncbi:MAG TPA: hypothetical protein VKB35_13960 [Ktedonobacteraceae bacterium]|nr:hypothetical protein [Ktedonobacteraceae bacterium]
MKPSVICTICTPSQLALHLASAGQKKGKKQKIYGAKCAIVAPYLAASRPRSHCPLSITDGEGAGGQESYGVAFQRPVPTRLGSTIE